MENKDYWFYNILLVRAEYTDYVSAAGVSLSERIFCCHSMVNFQKTRVSQCHLHILLSATQESSCHRKSVNFNFKKGKWKKTLLNCYELQEFYSRLYYISSNTLLSTISKKEKFYKQFTSTCIRKHIISVSIHS